MITQNHLCHHPWDTILVSVDGDCTFCCWMYGSIGSLKDSTLDEIWNGESANSIRQTMEVGEFPKCCTMSFTCPTRGRK